MPAGMLHAGKNTIVVRVINNAGRGGFITDKPSLPNTGMAVISDIGEWNDIHPLNKEDVGKRLALWAEKLAYGDQKVVYSGPLYQSMKVQG